MKNRVGRLDSGLSYGQVSAADMRRSLLPFAALLVLATAAAATACSSSEGGPASPAPGSTGTSAPGPTAPAPTTAPTTTAPAQQGPALTLVRVHYATTPAIKPSDLGLRGAAQPGVPLSSTRASR